MGWSKEKCASSGCISNAWECPEAIRLNNQVIPQDAHRQMTTLNTLAVWHDQSYLLQLHQLERNDGGASFCRLMAAKVVVADACMNLQMPSVLNTGTAL